MVMNIQLIDLNLVEKYDIGTSLMMQHASDINLKLKFAFTRTNSIDFISVIGNEIETYMNYYTDGFLVALD